MPENTYSGSNLIKKYADDSKITCPQEPLSNRLCAPHTIIDNSVANGLSTLASEDTCCRKRVSTRYPFHAPRMYIKEYFGVLPFNKNVLEHLSDEVRWMNPEQCGKAKRSFIALTLLFAFDNTDCIIEWNADSELRQLWWIANHYKWIIWKLACYERFYPAKHMGRFLTMSNVLEELNIENPGRRCIASTMVVLCVSAIHSTCDMKIGTHSVSINGSENSNAAKVELTDGWYSIDAFLDALLSKQLFAGNYQPFIYNLCCLMKIWGAGLCGWVGPVSPLEVRVLVLPWHFDVSRSNGGPVPQTLVRVTRIYPILYKERLSNGALSSDL
ncbi:Protein breast cancer susceptibility 2-like B [Vitis vinifera]|uniref:Protein breast cancer susceptibility 2-like B n=1 Tax=Vitis vinifera TaxID=29760 RepID=A0A438CW05_VITVI|nr:Protein breast cancer susceptibility 2-like B [Vitis vinifera]